MQNPQQLIFLTLYFTSHFCSLFALPEVVRIGGLFDNDENRQEHAFQKAIERINANRNILPRAKIVPQIENSVQGDSFRANKKACNILRKGVAAIFGPQSAAAAKHIQSICDTMEIPHLETRQYKMNRGSCLVNLFPHPLALSEAFASIVKAFRWKNYAIIYEDIDDLVHLQGLIGEHGMRPGFITRLSGETTDYRPLLKKMKNMGYSQIVIDCTAEKTLTVLKQAQQLGMTGSYHTYLLTSLDVHTLDLDDFRYGGANFTAFKLINFNRPEFKRILHDWDNATTIKTETALMYDAVYLFAKALHDLDASQQIDINPINCDSATDTFSHGFSLINYMKVIEIEGLSGLIKFDNQGFRTNVQFDVISLREDGIKTIGTWNSTIGLNFSRTYTETYTQIVESLHNKHFTVTTLLSAPYFMRKSSSDKLTGNNQFEGYVVDLTEEISKILGFNYTFRIVPDGRYGSLNRATNEWDGMIKELLEQRADLAVADLTITYDREQAVDFTMPFMNLGISVLYRKPLKHPPNLFSFLSPLSFDVWLYMATSYLGVSLLLFILARFSPYEWEHAHTCRKDTDIVENQFSLINSLWFVIGTLMQQGSDIVPKALSTRIVAGTWWFFTLIMISSYTANLAAFLTIERLESPITNAEDLAKQSSIKYGALRGGSTAAFFRDSNVSTYQRMWTVMETARPSVFTESNHEGVDRVIKGNGNYAFLMESTSIEYVTERHCKLTQIGGMLDSKGYGIATPPNSPFRTPISSAILKLQEGGVLNALKTKWWKEKRGGGSCNEDVHQKSNNANELTLASVGGVFVVLLAGLGLACITAVGEFMWKIRTEAIEGRVRHDLISSHVPKTKPYDILQKVDLQPPNY